MKRTALVVLLSVVAGALGGSLAFGTPFGINAHTAGTVLLDEVDALGVGWIRIDFIWSLVEPEQDVFDWALYDRIVRDANARGLKVYATIAATPAWATAGESAVGVPRDIDDWWDICYRAAARYRGQVAAWGMWNEPNLGQFWAGSRWEYQNVILLPGARAVHAADPAALVGGPELAHLNSADWDLWLQSCLGVAADDLDIATHHVYPSGVSASDVTDKLEVGGDYPWDPPSVREVVQDAGWWGKPFWLTETGAESHEAGEFAQSHFYYDLLGEWFPADGSKRWIDRMFFYELADDRNFPEITYGVLGEPPELIRKQAFWAYEDFVRTAVVSDAAVVGFNADLPLTPGISTAVVAQVRNEGTVAWVGGDGHRLTIDGLPPSWQVEGGSIAQGDVVPPGAVYELILNLTPPQADLDAPNRWSQITLRMALWDGTGFGSPRRETLGSGWHALPRFTVDPLSVVASQRDDVAFSVAVTSSSRVSYSWLLNGLEVEDGAVYSGATSNRLTVHGADRFNAGEYRCVARTDAGTVSSSPASLVLDGADGTGPREADGHAGGQEVRMPRFADVFPSVRVVPDVGGSH